MRRKLIKQGIGALTITLPKNWTSKYGLEGGDEIEMEEHEKTLLLKTEGKSSVLAKKVIKIDNLTQSLIWRYIISAYRLGYDDIIIKFSDIEKVYDIRLSSLGVLEKKGKMGTIEVIQDVVSRCIGLEVIDQGDDFCIIKDLGETSEKEFDNTVRRIFLLLLSMAEDSLKGFKNIRKNLRQSVQSSDANIDRFEDFCLRVLNKRGYKEFNKTSIIYSIILLLEFIGDEYKRIAIHHSEMKDTRISQRLTDIYENVNKLLNLYYELFHKFNEGKAIEIYEFNDRLDKDIEASNLRLNDEEKEILHHLKKIRRYVTDLLQLKIDLEL